MEKSSGRGEWSVHKTKRRCCSGASNLFNCCAHGSHLLVRVPSRCCDPLLPHPAPPPPPHGRECCPDTRLHQRLECLLAPCFTRRALTSTALLSILKESLTGPCPSYFSLAQGSRNSKAGCICWPASPLPTQATFRASRSLDDRPSYPRH